MDADDHAGMDTPRHVLDRAVQAFGHSRTV
jgi:hypothetical protein